MIEENHMNRVIIVGAGAAGLMAASQSACMGADTLLLEKMERPGRKLRITGKGRCNLTNLEDLEDFITHYGSNGRFLRQAFSHFFSKDLCNFFNGLGIETVTERGRRIFPSEGGASNVVDSLVKFVREKGVKIQTRSRVKQILSEHGAVQGVRIIKGSVSSDDPIQERIFKAARIIIATGGASYPATGSSGDGYELAKTLGHRIIPVKPSLVPLETKGHTAKMLTGLRLKNVMVSLIINGRKRSDIFGEMAFTDFGLTGPVILTLSRLAVESIQRGDSVTVSIDLKPALDKDKLDKRLIRDLDRQGKRKFAAILKGILPNRLIPVCIEQNNIPENKPGHQVTALERKRLCAWLKDFRFEVSNFRPFAEAIITAGGIDIKEIDPKTMSSRLVKGLYFAGEIMDLDGDTGGYNLQAAFSTGWLAGRSAAVW